MNRPQTRLIMAGALIIMIAGLAIAFLVQR